MPLDYSTLNVRELRRLPLYRLPKGFEVSDHLGSGCAGNAPGYPSYFLQSVYNSSGNTPRNGPDHVITDPERPGEYRVTDNVNLHTLWNPVSMESDRFKLWEYDCYRHQKHCYHDPDDPEGLLIWPIPMYQLIKVALETKRQESLAVFGNKQNNRIAWDWEIAQNTIKWHVYFNTRTYSMAEDLWMTYIESKLPIAVPENHYTVTMIRRFYPGYQPKLEMIALPPKTLKPEWWTRWSHPEQQDEEL